MITSLESDANPHYPADSIKLFDLTLLEAVVLGV
jgi:hypothetical protein